MITRPAVSGQPGDWRHQLAAAIRDPAELLALLELDPGLLPAARRAAARFPLLVPRPYVVRMRRGDPADPLLRQVLPLDAELEDRAGYVPDPVGDLAATVIPGVLSKYDGRVLLIASGTCAINCRYCFRREYPYAEQRAAADDWRAALAAIRRDRGCSEVILSGGDPLILSERRLTALGEALRTVAHVRRLRLHTRLPVVLPARIDGPLLGWLDRLHLPTAIVLHVNHPREIDEPVRGALRRLRTAGVTLLNQSVLLRGVNDDVDTLCGLSEALFDAGVLPYYLHLLDPVRGTAHFDLPVNRAVELVEGAAARLPGYLVPRLVREQPGAVSKIPVGRCADTVNAVAEGLTVPL
jgi:EF-P beta-lysylation protein EpmB